MPNEDNKILKYNHRENSMKVPFIIYAELKCLLEKMSFGSEFLFEKISSYHNHPEKLSTTKKYMDLLSDYLLFKQCSFDLTKNKFDCYRNKDCMERFWKDLKDHATKIIRYGKNKWYR